MTLRDFAIGALLSVTAAGALAAQQPGPPGPPPTGTSLILGRVVDATTNAPIAGVVVQLGPGAGSALPNSVARAALTDKQGRFVFRELPAGTYSMASRLGGNGFSPSGFLSRGWVIRLRRTFPADTVSGAQTVFFSRWSSRKTNTSRTR